MNELKRNEAWLSFSIKSKNEQKMQRKLGLKQWLHIAKQKKHISTNTVKLKIFFSQQFNFCSSRLCLPIESFIPVKNFHFFYFHFHRDLLFYLTECIKCKTQQIKWTTKRVKKIKPENFFIYFYIFYEFLKFQMNSELISTDRKIVFVHSTFKQNEKRKTNFLFVSSIKINQSLVDSAQPPKMKMATNCFLSLSLFLPVSSLVHSIVKVSHRFHPDRKKREFCGEADMT